MWCVQWGKYKWWSVVSGLAKGVQSNSVGERDGVAVLWCVGHASCASWQLVYCCVGSKVELAATVRLGRLRVQVCVWLGSSADFSSMESRACRW